jgi:hypothetical protein
MDMIDTKKQLRKWFLGPACLELGALIYFWGLSMVLRRKGRNFENWSTLLLFSCF